MDPEVYTVICKGTSKKIPGCFIMGLKVEGKWCMERAANDLTLLGANFMTINQSNN